MFIVGNEGTLRLGYLAQLFVEVPLEPPPVFDIGLRYLYQYITGGFLMFVVTLLLTQFSPA